MSIFELVRRSKPCYLAHFVAFYFDNGPEYCLPRLQILGPPRFLLRVGTYDAQLTFVLRFREVCRYFGALGVSGALGV